MDHGNDLNLVKAIEGMAEGYRQRGFPAEKAEFRCPHCLQSVRCDRGVEHLEIECQLVRPKA